MKSILSRVRIRLCRCLCLCALLVAPAAPAAAAGLTTDVEFAKIGDASLTLDAFVPEGEGPFPTCILVHGGGWVRGDKQSFIKPLFEPLGKAGFAWFTINYRLATTARWPACADDVATAVRWVRAHAKEYKVDVDRIALVGESAGGHLVGWVGAEAKDDTAVAAVVPFYAPFDLVAQAEFRKELGPFRELFGIDELNDETRKLIRAASPATKVRAGMKPYLLIHGDADATVPYEQSERFQKQMLAAGNTCDIIRVAGGAHGMGGWAKLGSDYQTQLIAWLRKTMK